MEILRINVMVSARFVMHDMILLPLITTDRWANISICEYLEFLMFL